MPTSVELEDQDKAQQGYPTFELVFTNNKIYIRYRKKKKMKTKCYMQNKLLYYTAKLTAFTPVKLKLKHFPVWKRSNQYQNKDASCSIDQCIACIQSGDQSASNTQQIIVRLVRNFVSNSFFLSVSQICSIAYILLLNLPLV